MWDNLVFHFGKAMLGDDIEQNPESKHRFCQNVFARRRNLKKISAHEVQKVVKHTLIKMQRWE